MLFLHPPYILVERSTTKGLDKKNNHYMHLAMAQAVDYKLQYVKSY
jgi:hypothetical protein